MAQLVNDHTIIFGNDEVEDRSLLEINPQDVFLIEGGKLPNGKYTLSDINDGKLLFENGGERNSIMESFTVEFGEFCNEVKEGNIKTA